MPIRRSLAEDFMTRKDKMDTQQLKETDVNEKAELQESNQPVERSTAEVGNVRKIVGGYLFDMEVKDKNLSLKNIFFPLKSIYTSENLKIRAELRESRERKRKIIAYLLLYPAAIVSLVVIISGFSKVIDYVKRTFNITGFNF